jgi:phosphohistidine phosphatase SixA
MKKYILMSITYLIAIGFQAITTTAVFANDELWISLKSNDHIVLIRHALAPGFGDPDNFNIKDCSTQRKLNNKGRDQALAIGKLFRSKGIDAANVYSSQWCRCAETARLLKLGYVSDLKLLNSFFGNFNRKQDQTSATRRWIKTLSLTVPTVLVTHQVNITALTGILPSSGELVFVERSSTGKLRVVGTIETFK